MRIDADDVIAEAANNILRAKGVVDLLNTLAWFFLIVGGLSVIATLSAVAADVVDAGVATASAVGTIIASLTAFALFRGLASIITLMVDRTLVEWADDAEA